MTIEQYIGRGLELSKQIANEIINKAEQDVFRAYVAPIIGYDAEASDYPDEIMDLAYCLLLRRNIIKTRFGAEIKSTQYGSQIANDNNTMMLQIAGICSLAFQSLKNKTTRSEPYLVTDIIDSGYYII